MRTLTLILFLALALAACGAPEPAPHTDQASVQRAAMDPTAVEVQRCKATVDSSGYHGVEATFRAVNLTQLEGVLSLTVQYQTPDGTMVTEGVPGASNIKPGQAVVLEDVTAVEEGDFPGVAVRCVVVAAEVYVPTE